MRKGIGYVLLGITAALALFLSGLFLGRNMNHEQVEMLSVERITLTQTLPLSLEKDERININTATAFELTQLPGIGQVLAGRIVEYRESNGPFTSITQLTLVEGIGNDKLSAIAELITAGA